MSTDCNCCAHCRFLKYLESLKSGEKPAKVPGAHSVHFDFGPADAYQLFNAIEVVVTLLQKDGHHIGRADEYLTAKGRKACLLEPWKFKRRFMYLHAHQPLPLVDPRPNRRLSSSGKKSKRCTSSRPTKITGITSTHPHSGSRWT